MSKLMEQRERTDKQGKTALMYYLASKSGKVYFSCQGFKLLTELQLMQRTWLLLLIAEFNPSSLNQNSRFLLRLHAGVEGRDRLGRDAFFSALRRCWAVNFRSPLMLRHCTASMMNTGRTLEQRLGVKLLAQYYLQCGYEGSQALVATLLHEI